MQEKAVVKFCTDFVWCKLFAQTKSRVLHKLTVWLFGKFAQTVCANEICMVQTVCASVAERALSENRRVRTIAYGSVTLVSLYYQLI